MCVSCEYNEYWTRYQYCIINNFISTLKPQEEDQGCSYGLSFLLAIISFLATEVFLADDHGVDEDVM